MGRDEPTTGRTAGLDLEFVAKASLIVIGLWALANMVWLARDVLFIAFFALLVASFLSIFVEPLHDRLGLKRAIAAPAVLVTIILILVGLSVLAWPTLREQIELIQSRLPQALDSAEAWAREQVASLGGDLGEIETQLRDGMGGELSGLIGGAVPLLNTVIGALAGLLLVVIAGLFIAISPRTYMHGLIVMFPRTQRRRMGEVLPEAGAALTQWMKGTAMAMMVVGTMSAVGLWLIGVPAALALGVIAGLLEFIPYIGPALSFVPAIVVALAISPEKAIWVVGLYALIQFTESNLLMPLLMKKMVELPPALTLLFQTMMGVLFGFLGLLLAVPILATTKVLVQDLYVEGVADEH
ncbi:AI-2E family transporter [soil metagenome]